MTTYRYDRGIPAPAHLGVLIIRVWREDTNDPAALRARLTESINLDTDERTIATAATIEGIRAEVGNWLNRFLAQPTADATPPET